jgi:hypothetical protein
MRNPLRRVKRLLVPPVDLAPVRSAITGPCLIVVSRDRQDIFEYLRRQFARDERVEVVLDRRSGYGRRRNHERSGVERRAGDRRKPPSAKNDLALYDFVIVPRNGTGPATQPPTA